MTASLGSKGWGGERKGKRNVIVISKNKRFIINKKPWLQGGSKSIVYMYLYLTVLILMKIINQDYLQLVKFEYKV